MNFVRFKSIRMKFETQCLEGPISGGEINWTAYKTHTLKRKAYLKRIYNQVTQIGDTMSSLTSPLKYEGGWIWRLGA